MSIQYIHFYLTPYFIVIIISSSNYNNKVAFNYIVGHLNALYIFITYFTFPL